MQLSHSAHHHYAFCYVYDDRGSVWAALCRVLVPRQRKFYEDLTVINGCLDELISRAKETRQANDIEALQSRDYSKVPAADLPQCLPHVVQS